MNKLIPITLTLVLLAGVATISHAEEKKSATPSIKALLITGGCCHDYDNQKTIIPEAIAAHSTAAIDWTVIHQGGKTTNTKIPFYNDPHWAKGYDVVVHNECFAAVGDADFIAGILKPHIDGIPAVLVHCSMHCYRTGPTAEDWYRFCGAHSRRHGPHHAFQVRITAPEHEIMRGLSNWTTPKGELYFIEKTYPGVTPLAEATSNKDGKVHSNAWVHEYGPKKTRVFATTIGHHNETMLDPAYQQMLTRGLLWAAGQVVDTVFRY